jgi:hypothetical protein
MAYVIAEPCIDVLDRAVWSNARWTAFSNAPAAVYIHPEECVDSGGYEPVGPVGAIFHEVDVPDQWAAFTIDNARFFADLCGDGTIR